MTAGIVNLEVLSQPAVYEELERKSAKLAAGMKKAAEEAGLTCQFNGWVPCSRILYPCPGHRLCYRHHLGYQKYAVWFKKMLELGIYFAPSQLRLPLCHWFILTKILKNH